MELIVETSIQLRCEHGSIYQHADHTQDGAICVPAQAVETNAVQYPFQSAADPNILEAAFDRLARDEVDMIQIMARRL